mmetsp:Transcript_58451/g.152997  ORF Transcript_58451/g.152997 Transcript_58451/m.152997 type:complete len:266 (+) Transcript_58451:4270-5067(+)
MAWSTARAPSTSSRTRRSSRLCVTPATPSMPTQMARVPSSSSAALPASLRVWASASPFLAESPRAPVLLLQPAARSRSRRLRSGLASRATRPMARSRALLRSRSSARPPAPSGRPRPAIASTSTFAGTRLALATASARTPGWVCRFPATRAAATRASRSRSTRTAARSAPQTTVPAAPAAMAAPARTCRRSAARTAAGVASARTATSSMSWRMGPHASAPFVACSQTWTTLRNMVVISTASRLGRATTPRSRTASTSSRASMSRP